MVAVLKKSHTAGLVTHYYIYGISYGSVEATVLTALIERQGLIAPKGLVLAGTVGKFYKDAPEYLQGLIIFKEAGQ